jgi:hypothetical protein
MQCYHQTVCDTPDLQGPCCSYINRHALPELVFSPAWQFKRSSGQVDQLRTLYL